jgi:hypothetical protein
MFETMHQTRKIIFDMNENLIKNVYLSTFRIFQVISPNILGVLIYVERGAVYYTC